jgi:hypothetical protein
VAESTCAACRAVVHTRCFARTDRLCSSVRGRRESDLLKSLWPGVEARGIRGLTFWMAWPRRMLRLVLAGIWKKLLFFNGTVS